MRLLLGRFLPHIAGGLLLALAAMTIAWRVQTGRLEDRTRERDQALGQVTQLLAAAKGKDTTIAALEASAEAWRKLATTSEAMKAAADLVDATRKTIEARASALAAAEERDRANPDCAALLALDIARACPAIAAGVRTRAAASGVRGPPDRGAGAGGAEGR